MVEDTKGAKKKTAALLSAIGETPFVDRRFSLFCPSLRLLVTQLVGFRTPRRTLDATFRTDGAAEIATPAVGPECSAPEHLQAVMLTPASIQEHRRRQVGTGSVLGPSPWRGR